MKRRGRPRIGTARVAVVLTPDQARWIELVRSDGQSRADVIRSLIELSMRTFKGFKR